MFMALNKGGEKKTKYLGARITQGTYDTVLVIKDRIKERSNGLAEPDDSAIALELMGFTPKHLIYDEDREYVRQRMEAGHPPIQSEGIKKAG